MFKKLFLCLFLTTDLYPAEQERNDTLSTAAMTAVIVTAGALVFAMYASDEKKFEELTSKLSDGDIAKMLEVAGAWFTLTQVMQGLIYAPDTFKEAYKDWFPTEEQIAIDKVETAAAIEKIKLFEARNRLRECFMKHKSGCEKNALGRPADCEELAQIFASLGGQDEVDGMTKAFNKHWK